MRPIEVVLTVLVLLTLAALFSARLPRRLLGILGMIDLLVLLLHAVVEGPHWQMAPAYLGLLSLAPLAAIRKPTLKRVFAGGIVLLVAASCGFSVFLPMFRLPEPTGPYAIGTEILPLVNDHPRDASSAGADGKRALMIQIWYPASPSNAPRAPYRKLSETTLLSSYQAVLWTHGRWNAPLAAGGSPMPVLILNPGWNSRRTYHMYLVEDLVSHGYIVVGVDHTGNSGPTAFPDGHVSQPLDDPRMNFFTYTYPQVNVYGARQQAIQVDDDRFVLDELERWNQQPSSRYYRRLDMDRVAALGHSFGGSVSAEDCLDDPRFKAALDLDGSFWGPVQKAGMTRPLMMIEEDYDVYTPDELKNNPGAKVDYLFDLSDDAMMARSNGYRIVIHGSTHSSYTDRSLFSPFKQYSGEGRVPKMREYAMIRSYALAFFDKTLRGVASPLLDPSRQAFPEATLTVLHWPAS